MEGLWQLLFLASQCDLESLTEDLNFLFTQMWFIQFLYCDIWKVLCLPVLEWDQQEKKEWFGQQCPRPNTLSMFLYIPLTWYWFVSSLYDTCHKMEVVGIQLAAFWMQNTFFLLSSLGQWLTESYYFEIRNMMPWFLPQYCVFCRVCYHKHHLP